MKEHLSYFTKYALQPSFICKCPLTAIALECPFILEWVFDLSPIFFNLFLFELFSLLLQILECIVAPVSTAQGTRDLLCTRHLMLDPHLDAVGMDVPAAADFTKCEVLCLLHLLVTHTAHLLWVQLHSRDVLFFVRGRLFLVFFRGLSVVTSISKPQLDNLWYFWVNVRQLPQQRVLLTHPEYLQQRVYLHFITTSIFLQYAHSVLPCHHHMNKKHRIQ
jgi:hypothetical protein